MDVQTRLARRLRNNRASILSDAEVKVMVAEARQCFGSMFVDVGDGGDVRFEDHVRWSSLGARCQAARAELRVDTKAAASALKIPRYRIEAIEKGMLSELRPDFAWRYFAFLGIDAWVRRWMRANSELSKQARLEALPSAVGPTNRRAEAGNLTTRCSGPTRLSRRLRGKRRARRPAAERER